MSNEIQPKVLSSEDTQGIQASMDNNGYCVVNIQSIDVDKLKDLFRKDLSQIVDHPVDTDKMWTMRPAIDFPRTQMTGLLGEYGLSQGDAAWHVRTNLEIQSIFSKLLKATPVDLVCSFEAIGFSTTESRIYNRKVLHVDQNPYIPGGNINSIQAIFYAESSQTSDNEADPRATTVVVPGSHKDWLDHNYRLHDGHHQAVDQEKYWSKAFRLVIPAGCLLVFSSKLIHQGWSGPQQLCFMVSYGLKSDRDEDSRIRKIVMYLGGHQSTHWSQFGQYHGVKWRYGEPWKMIVPSLTASADETWVESLLEDAIASDEWYEFEFDSYIPKDRLTLI